MNEFINAIKSDKTLFRGFGIAFSFLVIGIIAAAGVYTILPPFIPLYNQMPWGEARLGEKLEIFIPIATVGLIMLINILICSVVYKKMPLIARLMCISTVLASFLLLFLITRIIMLVLL